MLLLTFGVDFGFDGKVRRKKNVVKDVSILMHLSVINALQKAAEKITQCKTTIYDFKASLLVIKVVDSSVCIRYYSINLKLA